MARRKVNMIRQRISIPESDISVLEWINNQSNVSFSIRMMIKEYIEKYGYSDITCRKVDKQLKRGRPPKMDNNTEDNIIDSDQCIQVLKENDVIVDMKENKDGQIDINDMFASLR